MSQGLCIGMGFAGVASRPGATSSSATRLCTSGWPATRPPAGKNPACQGFCTAGFSGIASRPRASSSSAMRRCTSE